MKTHTHTTFSIVHRKKVQFNLVGPRKGKQVVEKMLCYLKIVEYTSQRIPPVQYINISVFSLSTFSNGSAAMT